MAWPERAQDGQRAGSSETPLLPSWAATSAGAAPALRYQSTLSAVAFLPGTLKGVVSSVASDDVFHFTLNPDGSLAGLGIPGQPVFAETQYGQSDPLSQNNVMPTGVVPHRHQGQGADIPAPDPFNTIHVLHEFGENVSTIQLDAMGGRFFSMEPLALPLFPPDSARTSWKQGKHFFATSTGRWGNNGMVGCMACHPGNGAFSDGVTWYLAPGPRQSLTLDSLFGKEGDVHTGAPILADHRAHNWTALFDEVADLEGNTRGVSGGMGGIYISLDAGQGFPPQERAINMDTAGPPGPDGGPTPAQGLRNSAKDVCEHQSHTPDWNDVEVFLLAMRAPNAPLMDSARETQVARGRQLFEQASCASCHGGSKWSSSRVPYDPLTQVGGVFSAETAHVTPFTVDGGYPFTIPGLMVAGDDVPPDVDAGFPSPVIERLACVLRNVDTYFVDGGQSPLEVRANMKTGNWAQGRGGFNPPTLTGLRYSAPFLHNGAAASLKDLFTHPAWGTHMRAGNAAFSPSNADVEDLVAFLESIDDSTPVMPPAPYYNLCPQIF